MEKLNEISGFLAKNPDLADCVKTFTYGQIHEFAEAFRVLERRLEVAEQGEKTFEDGFCSVRRDRDEWKQRAEAAAADVKRMDWLCAHCVEVRYPLMYGSREMFRAQQDSEEWDLPHHTKLRDQVDEAMRNIEDSQT